MFEPTPSGPAPPVRPPFFEAFAPLQLILLGLSLVFLQQFLLGVASRLMPSLLLAILVVVTASLVLLPLWMMSRHPGSLRRTLRLRLPPWRQLGWLGLVTVGLVLTVDFLGTWNSRLVGVPEDFAETMAQLTPTTAVEWVLSLLALCLVVPAGEEIVFRGIIQRAARLSLHGPTAAVLCGLLFGVLHLEPWYLAPLALMGVVMGVVYEITGTLVAPIFVHGLYNTVVVVNQTFAESPAVAGAGTGRIHGPLAIAGVATAVFALGKLKPCLPWTESASTAARV